MEYKYDTNIERQPEFLIVSKFCAAKQIPEIISQESHNKFEDLTNISKCTRYLMCRMHSL